jgi:hypothetical protein
MDETTRTSGRHSTDDPYGTAYDLIRQATGADWVEPSRHHHAEPESFAGDLDDNRDMAVA